MRAYVTSIGEKTTDTCVWQLKRLGFDVLVLSDDEPWIDKYVKFIYDAVLSGEPCIRIDADIIPNKKLKILLDDAERLKDDFDMPEMVQFMTYDLYRNDIGITCPVYYSPGALKVIRKHIEELDPKRPETSAWRLAEMIGHTATSSTIVGFHGFYQDFETISRAEYNKIERKQIEEYDFEVAHKLLELLKDE